MLTQEVLKETIHYDPKEGVFTWLKATGARCSVGSEAGCSYHNHGNDYRKIGIQGKRYKSHRLAYLYMTGELPSLQVDHQDGNGLNNAWENLRLVTNKENHRNMRLFSNNSSGCHGVYWHRKNSKWIVQFQIKGKLKHLGCFVNLLDAIECRKSAEAERGYHYNHGRTL